MLLSPELSHEPLSHGSLPRGVEQIDLFGIDPEHSEPLPLRKTRYRDPLRPVLQAAPAEVLEEKETQEETYAEIYDWLLLNAEFELDGQMRPLNPEIWTEEDDRQFLEKQLTTLLGLLEDQRASNVQRRAVLDWMIGGILTWDSTQKTLLSFCTACEINEVDPRSFGELILHHCVSKGIVPTYARVHLAAWRWLEHLPRKQESREVKRGKLRWLFAPLLSEREIRISPLLCEPERSKAIAAFNSACTQYGADLELTRRLVWFHAVRWRVVPFDVHARLTAQD